MAGRIMWASRGSPRDARSRVREDPRWAAEQTGIRQFLDVGTGLPTVDNVHDVAQRIAPESRVVYVDNDPLVLVHARALLTRSSEGATAYIDAGLHEPQKIIDNSAVRDTLDFSQQVALMLVRSCISSRTTPTRAPS
jgi:hypothetical protein